MQNEAFSNFSISTGTETSPNRTHYYNLTLDRMSREKRSSEALRKAGNEIYCRVSEGCYGPCLLRLKLNKAHELYEKALTAARRDNNERASCYKNLGAVNWLWGKSEWQIYMQEADDGNDALQAIWAAKKRISKSLEFYLLALQFGECGNKPETWVTQAEESIEKILEWVVEQLCTYTVCFEPILIELCGLMENAGYGNCQRKKEIGTELFILHVEFIFNQGFKCITNDNEEEDEDDYVYNNQDDDEEEDIRIEETGYKRCLNAMRECHVPLSKAEALAHSTNDDDLIQEFQSLKEQVLLYEFICESVQARCQGDVLLEKALFEDQAGSMELVWDAIDWYRHSILLSNDKDPESDAIALSRIGKIYSSVLKLEKQAHRYHLESTKIAEDIMCPRIADSEWYNYSLLKVQEYQRNLLVEEDEIEYNQSIQETINLIKVEGKKSSQCFLQFIYEEHSHPDPRKREMGNIGATENVKAALRKAIVAYHPDNNGHYDQRWKLLCEEITKVLNCKYEVFK